MRIPVPSRGLEWTSVMLGAGLYCAAFSLGDEPAAAASAGISGLFIAICSIIALNRYRDWTQWLNVTLGSWALISPFMLGFESHQTAFSVHLTVGLCVSTIATMQLIMSRQAMLARAKVARKK